jgi:Uma2 family endonuclease
MAMPVRIADTDWTVDRVHALPDDGNRYEVLDGELFVTPAPALRHQAALAELHRRLSDYVRPHRIGWALFAPADIIFSPRRLLQPDCFVVPMPPDGVAPASLDPRSLLVVVEVLSPGTARADRYRKRAIYMDEGLVEYWIIDLGHRLIERWQPGDTEPAIITDELVWAPRVGTPAFTLDVVAYFADVETYPGT